MHDRRATRTRTRVAAAFFLSVLVLKKILKLHTGIGSGILLEEERCLLLPQPSGDTNRRWAKGANNRVPLVPLQVLTRSDEATHVDCPPLMSPVYDRVVVDSAAESNTHRQQQKQRIPKQIHVAWIRGRNPHDIAKDRPHARCLPDDFVRYTDIWKRQFPSYSFHFHDDHAVDRLLFGREWAEFPHLQLILQHCLKFGGAVKIDIWRSLVLYAYGGIYSDLDAAPTDEISEQSIGPNDSAFFFSDTRNRPTQGCQGMTPDHPIAFNTLMQILTNLLGSENIASIKPVYTTGPGILKEVYINLMGTLDPGLHHTEFTGYVRKVARDEGHLFVFGDERRETVRWNATMTVTKRQRVEWLLQTKHWSEQIRLESERLVERSCWREIYEVINSNRRNP